ncbi:hypothetical protein ACI4X5_000212 [Campylobacter upsaliensis]
MNLYILTEERPKQEVLHTIITRFLQDKKFCAFIDMLKILPIVKENCFTFGYEILGVSCKAVEKIYVKIVSGASSFVDYLVFFQEGEPSPKDIPLYAIEETKTNDSESRNTGVYQRITKFVYLNNFYPQTTKIMLYNLKTELKSPTQTSIFGTRILRTLGVEIIGKDFRENDEILKPFESIKELIDYKNSMRKPPKNNVPLNIYKAENVIFISARLFKANTLSHDPNIGAVSGICAALRKLGFKENLTITHHGLEQKHLGKNNKFIQIANVLHIDLDGLTIPKAKLPQTYWHYETQGEKLATIFIHLVVEHFSSAYGIFENHAGCEKSYFLTADGNYIALQKYEDKQSYKQGNKKARLFIPDLILLDPKNLEIINIEGKKYINKQQGIKELNNYDCIETEYISKYYKNYKIIRTLVLYGSLCEEIIDIEVGFLLNEKGKMILGIKAPKIFTQSLENLLAFWKPQ